MSLLRFGNVANLLFLQHDVVFEKENYGINTNYQLEATQQ